MNLLTIILYITAVTSAQIHLTQEQQVAVLQEAQVAYDLGVSLKSTDSEASNVSFRRASNRYQLLIDDGVKNGNLWYNLGNAQLQSGEIGESIAAYRSAERFIPSNGRLSTNLQYARSLVNNPVSNDDATSLIHRLTTLHTAVPIHLRLTATVVFWIACWVFISMRLCTKVQYFKTISIVLAIVTLVLGTSVGVDLLGQHQEYGVVVEDEVIVRKGNGMNYAPMFVQPINEGIEFEIIEFRSNWLHIRLQNGAQGWIQMKDAQIV